MDDEQQIRDLIERWAAAVHAGDMQAVLADHASDIVMYDVPPPSAGVRGLDAYRETWPPFFQWQASGAAFSIITLHVTAGTDVAFAHALLHCGTAPADPDNQLRLTFGLVKEQGRWVIRHEHHSFPHGTAAPDAEETVREIHRHWFACTAAKDLDGLMEHIADDVVSYEHGGELQYAGIDAVREVCRAGLEVTAGQIAWEVPDLTIRAGGDVAVSWGLDHITLDTESGERIEGWSRGTRVFARRQGRWQLLHQHVSQPLPSPAED